MKAVKELHTETVFYEPRDFDFSKGYPDTWDIVLSPRIRQAIDNGEDELDNYAPLMNYWYPLPASFSWDIDPDKASNILEKSPVNLTLVWDSGSEYGLALTGGGMDFSWEICEGYMRLGYLPPIHFCDLPNFAGKKLDARAKWVMAGCRRSLKVASFRIATRLASLDKLRDEMKARA